MVLRAGFQTKTLNNPIPRLCRPHFEADCRDVRNSLNSVAMKSVLIENLLLSEEPSIRWKIRANVLKESDGQLEKLRKEIKTSARTCVLLSRLKPNGQFQNKKNPYDKWQGSHWVLAALADLGYPTGDKNLLRMKDDVLDYWLAPEFFTEFEAKTKSDAYKHRGVPCIDGRYRRCASQQGYALWYLQKLGLSDNRIDQLVERLLHWQWPDGGWNCDKNPAAHKSTLVHTAISLRGLALYAKNTGSRSAKRAADRAAEVLLEQRIFKSRRDGKVLNREFMYFHYPLYWHYDVLGALKILAESGYIRDHRCSEALDHLESQQLRSGGWAASKKYYKISKSFVLNGDYVDWGPTGKSKMNSWITADALFILTEAGRM